MDFANIPNAEASFANCSPCDALPKCDTAANCKPNTQANPNNYS
jgi:hypothetical protein